MQNIPHLKWIGIAVGSFLLPFTFATAQSCGDFISTYDFGDGNGPVEDRQPVEDCDNPFGFSEEPMVTRVSVTLAEQQLVNGSLTEVLSVPIEVPVVIDVQPGGYDVYSSLIFHEGEDYRYVDEYVAGSVQFAATGTYTIITDVSGYFTLDDARQTLWQAVKGFWLPVAQAQIIIAPTRERHVTTFTIELTEKDPEPPIGASSVLFLPGIKASRLYVEGLDGSERVWEPGSDADVESLAMTEDGVSVNSVHTNDVLDEVFGIVDIYKGFLNKMQELKTDEIIHDFTPFAYDWRYDVFAVATEDVSYDDSESKRLLDEVLLLADESYTGKVTLIAHSNGGLVAKALLHEFGDTELAGKVDKLVMIGTPQLGTPKAIASLLHGLDESIPFISSAEVARQVSRNIPGSYTLLPSAKYFESDHEPLITTDGSDLAGPVADYGEINTATQLQSLLLDSQSRRGEAAGLNDLMILNQGLALQAEQSQSVLDSWEAPEGVDVYEVVGTGLATIKGFEYREYGCSSSNPFCILDSYLKPFPILSNEGDQTVMALSAEAYAGDKTVMKVNLEEANKGITTPDREHKDLPESESIQAFIDSIIKYPYLTDSVIVPDFTEVSSRYRIIAAHSPVSLSATDKEGRQAGEFDGAVKTELANSQYFKLGGSSYLVLSYESEVEVEVRGTETGVYTLSIDELSAEGVQQQVSVLVATSTGKEMRAQFSIAGPEYSTITTDFDNDGVADLEQTLDGERISGPSAEYTYSDLKHAIQSLNLSSKDKRYLLRKVKLAQFFNIKAERKKYLKRVESLVLKSMNKRISFLKRRNKLSVSEFNRITKLIKNIQTTHE